MRSSINNSVRRRLFADDDPTEQAKNDNFANMLQESMERDREEKKRRWNFDFQNELPLDGDYEWYRSDGMNDWIGIKSDTKICLSDTKIRRDIYELGTKICEDIIMKENEQLFRKFENEATPKTNKEEGVPLIRKRRKSEECSVSVTGARRKISFD